MNGSSPPSPDPESILRNSDFLDPEAISRAEALAAEMGLPLERAAIALGLLTEDQFLYLLSEESGVELVFPDERSVDRDLVSAFPSELLRRHGALPLVRDDGGVVVALPEVPGEQVVEEFGEVAVGRVRFVLASPHRLGWLIDRVVGGGAGNAERITAEDAAGMTVFYRHLATAFGEGAEELRFEPSAEGVLVRARTGGRLVRLAVEPLAHFAGIATRARTLAGLDGAEEGLPATGTFATRVAGRDLDLRTTILQVSGGEHIVLRRETKVSNPVDLDDFELPGEVSSYLRRTFGAPAGSAGAGGSLVLVAAPDPSLVLAFARACLDSADPANCILAVGSDLPGTPRAAPRAPTIAEAVRAATALTPDLLYVDGGSEALGAKEVVAAALAGVRVLYGLVEPLPEDAPVLMQAAGVSVPRLDLVLQAVVALRRNARGVLVSSAILTGVWRESRP